MDQLVPLHTLPMVVNHCLKNMLRYLDTTRNRASFRYYGSIGYGEFISIVDCPVTSISPELIFFVYEASNQDNITKVNIFLINTNVARSE